MARFNLTRLRSLAVGLAVVSLSFAACSKSAGTGPVPGVSPTPTSPGGPGSPSALGSPCAGSFGIAYEPDGGNGGGFHGVQVAHFEDNAGNLCGVAPAPATTPGAVAFAAPVGPLAFASDLSDALAILQNSSGGFTLVQSVFGASVGAIVPVGTTYDLSQLPPTPAPVATTTPSPSPTSTPPLISDAESIAIIAGSTQAIAVTTGAVAPGSFGAIVGLTGLTNAPPLYGFPAPYSGSTYTLKSIPNLPRSIVRIGVDSRANIVALVRGPQDLLSFGITVVGSGYQFDAKADDTSLGSNALLRGNGAIAFDPLDVSRALVGGATAAGQGMLLTLVTGLPTAITKTATIALPGNINSVAITNTGAFGVIGTDAGIVVVKGVDTGTLTIVQPFAATPSSGLASVPNYRTCTGAAANLTHIASVGLSADARYLVALGTTAGIACASGYDASLVAVPFNPATGSTPSPAPAPSAGSTASPVPTAFVQNNVIAPPPGADYLFVH